MSKPLQLRRTLGFESSCGVISLSSDSEVEEQRQELFYACSNVGVVENLSDQTHLEGHDNMITSICASFDKRTIVSSCQGKNSALIVWDVEQHSKVKTYSTSLYGGAVAVDISHDGQYVAILSREHKEAQFLYVFDILSESIEPLYSEHVPINKKTDDRHTCLRFNPASSAEIITNGPSNVLFWKHNNSKLISYAPFLSEKERNRFGSKSAFCVSAFFPGTAQASTSTENGQLIIWDEPKTDTSLENNHGLFKEFVKVIQLSKESICVLETSNNYLCLAGDDGAVRFYDFSIRLVAWFEDLDAGPIRSVNFNVPAISATLDCDFYVPDFVVSTGYGVAVSLKAEQFNESDPMDRRGLTILRGMIHDIVAVAFHPQDDKLLCIDSEGEIFVWNTEDWDLLASYKTQIQAKCMEYHPEGEKFAIGASHGSLHIISKEMKERVNFNNGDSPIKFIRFSTTGEWMATCDTLNYVAIYNRKVAQDRASNTEGMNWIFCGRIMSHSKSITGVEFGLRENGNIALVSVSEDCHLVEYDLDRTSIEEGVCIIERVKIEENCFPSACMWHPLLNGDYEDRIVVSTSNDKIKQYNADDKCFRKLTRGPTKSRMPIISFLPLASSHYAAFSTAGTTIGLVKMPFDGNPKREIEAFAHPLKVQSIDVHNIGCSFLASTGGLDRSIKVWKMNTQQIDDQEEVAVKQVESKECCTMYSDLLSETLLKKITEIFIFVLAQDEKECCKEDEKLDTGLSTKVHVKEIPNIFRALGFFPSEKEVKDIMSQVSMQDFTTTGEIKVELTLDEFIVLYVNYKRSRPESSLEEITEAFQTLSNDNSALLSWRELDKFLSEADEPMNLQEQKICQDILSINKDGVINSKSFSKAVLQS